MRVIALLLLLPGALQVRVVAGYDGWVSTAKVQDKATIEAIYASLKELKVKPGPLARSHGHWLIGIHLTEKPKILGALRRRGFAKKVIFSDDPLSRKSP